MLEEGSLLRYALFLLSSEAAKKYKIIIRVRILSGNIFSNTPIARISFAFCSFSGSSLFKREDCEKGDTTQLAPVLLAFSLLSRSLARLCPRPPSFAFFCLASYGFV